MKVFALNQLGNLLIKVQFQFTAPATEQVLSYSQNTTNSIQLINGVLVMTAVQQNILERNFTTATINAKHLFQYGRVDLRVALPQGKALKTVMLLIKAKENYEENRGDENIEILADLQFDNFYTRIAHYNSSFGTEASYPANRSFQVYSLEWNKQMITWKLNGETRRKFHLDRVLDSFYEEKGQPFNAEFYLSIRLQVYKFKNDELSISNNFHTRWNCPSLLIDYVRIYQQDNTTENQLEVLKNSNSTEKMICNKVKDNLKNFYKQDDWFLAWHDEFDGQELDQSKWFVTDGKDKLEGNLIIIARLT